MSNNKQQTAMKLYTEEQVLEIIANINRDVNVSSKELLEGIEVKPIELPTDEDIREVIKPFQNEMDDFDLGFRNGVQWLREKIKGGEQ
jgi:hypothetical protein